MKRLMLIASVFVIAGLATAGLVRNHNNPVPNGLNPVPPCIPTGCK